jgi:hypothetical protein
MDANFDIKSYRERWKPVEEFECEELRSLTMEMHLQQMITIWQIAVGPGFLFEPDDSEMKAFTRWAKLKDLYEEQHKQKK